MAIEIRNDRRDRRRPDGQRHRPGLRARPASTSLLNDVTEERINAGLATINGNMARQVAQGQRSREAERAGRAGAGSRPAPAYEDFGGCDIVIEAATENEEVKRKIFTDALPRR